MSQQGMDGKRKLTAKDAITAGALGAVCIAIRFLFMLAGGVSPGGGRGPAVGGAPFGAPGAFAVPEQPHRPDEEREPDPRRR